MSALAALAAKPAALATGFGASLVPAIGTGSLDGFVVGALMSGACVTMITAPGRARRRAARVADDAIRPSADLSRYFDGAVGPSADPGRYFLAAEKFEPERGRQVPPADRGPDQAQGDSCQDGQAPDWAQDGQGAGGYQSRHRLGDGNAIRQPRLEPRRSAPRHAAPPAGFVSRMNGLFAGRALIGAGSASRAG
ncbi:MAG: hypothetical protein ABSB01_03995 [Streptosporangiaceae bacterium]|jgi:hypothetical protein